MSGPMSGAAGPVGMVILDRDGVINEMVVNADHGTVDSPLNPGEARLRAGAAEAIAELTRAGARIAIATNQPAAAKGKTTLANLEAVHARILAEVAAAGGVVASSQICFHRAEDGCACRKPRTALLERALAEAGVTASARVWMVGDGITDVEAGKRLGLSTAFIGSRKPDVMAMMDAAGGQPDLWCASLAEFARAYLARQ